MKDKCQATCQGRMGSDAKILEGIECGGPHQLLPRRTKLVGVSLVSGQISPWILDAGYMDSLFEGKFIY